MKKNERLLDNFGYISDEYIAEAAPPEHGRKSAKKLAMRLTTAAACIALIAAIGLPMLLRPGNDAPDIADADGDRSVTDETEGTVTNGEHEGDAAGDHDEPDPFAERFDSIEGFCAFINGRQKGSTLSTRFPPEAYVDLDSVIPNYEVESVIIMSIHNNGYHVLYKGNGEKSGIRIYVQMLADASEFVMYDGERQGNIIYDEDGSFFTEESADGYYITKLGGHVVEYALSDGVLQSMEFRGGGFQISFCKLDEAASDRQRELVRMISDPETAEALIDTVSAIIRGE